ncbi:hypothetical protein [Reticulibacter mediterranei]|nr:hypothetical protein [Reticulibacter mediterranei]
MQHSLHCCNVLNELQRLHLMQQKVVVDADLHKALTELQRLPL